MTTKNTLSFKALSIILCLAMLMSYLPMTLLAAGDSSTASSVIQTIADPDPTDPKPDSSDPKPDDPSYPNDKPDDKDDPNDNDDPIYDPDKDQDVDAPQTGNDPMLHIWITVMIISGCGIICTSRRGLRRRSETAN